ncbi:hypothetical protein [Morganella psychrotolerans]|uniref:hypothetical protein n=1 Tax=Morganella psychrotolerans TaxID=368603 RepID=UPI0012E79F2A|nr:hypothetical protein [Morganella psychrotolerans]
MNQPRMITGSIAIGTQTGTQRNSLVAPAYHFVDITGMVAAEVSDNHRTDHQRRP